jgi:hypothetical protein
MASGVAGRRRPASGQQYAWGGLTGAAPKATSTSPWKPNTARTCSPNRPDPHNHAPATVLLCHPRFEREPGCGRSPPSFKPPAEKRHDFFQRRPTAGSVGVGCLVRSKLPSPRGAWGVSGGRLGYHAQRGPVRRRGQGHGVQVRRSRTDRIRVDRAAAPDRRRRGGPARDGRPSLSHPLGRRPREHLRTSGGRAATCRAGERGVGGALAFLTLAGAERGSVQRPRLVLHPASDVARRNVLRPLLTPPTYRSRCQPASDTCAHDTSGSNTAGPHEPG